MGALSDAPGRSGFRRDAQLDAICRYALWAAKISRKHPDDRQLSGFARKALLMTAQEIALERECQIRRDLLADRLADCEDCARAGEGKPCADGKPCAWRLPEQQRAFVQQFFGADALKFVEQYRQGRE